MLLLPADDELAADGDEHCQRGDGEIIGSEQQAKGQG